MDDEALRIALERGEAYRAIAAKLGVHPASIYRRARRLGHRRHRRLTPELHARIRAAAEAGDSCAAIARHLGVPRTTVRRVLAEQPRTRPAHGSACAQCGELVGNEMRCPRCGSTSRAPSLVEIAAACATLRAHKRR